MNSDEKSVGITLAKRSVFVSHASKNFKIADEIRTLLEEQGIGCWIAPRDIPPGGQYGTSIVEAIRDCTIVVLLLTDEANKSKPVENEIERAFNHQKTIVPIRLREITPSKGLEFFVSNAQWVDAIVSPLKGRIDQIVNIVHAIELDKPIITPEPEVPTLLGRVERKLEQALRHKVLSVSVAFAVLVLLIASVLGVQMATQGGLQTATTSISKSADRIDGAANTLEQTSGTIKGIDAKLGGVKKETSDDPRKELANMGHQWGEEDFVSSLNDPQLMALYKRGSMQVSMESLLANTFGKSLSDTTYQQLISNNYILHSDSCNLLSGTELVLLGIHVSDKNKIALIRKYCDANGNFTKQIIAGMRSADQDVKKSSNEFNLTIQSCVKRLTAINRPEWEKLFALYEVNAISFKNTLLEQKFTTLQSQALHQLMTYRSIARNSVENYYKSRDTKIIEFCDMFGPAYAVTAKNKIEMELKLDSFKKIALAFDIND